MLRKLDAATISRINAEIQRAHSAYKKLKGRGFTDHEIFGAVHPPEKQFKHKILNDLSQLEGEFRAFSDQIVAIEEDEDGRLKITTESDKRYYVN